LLNKPSKNGRPDNFAAAVTEVSERMSVLVREEIELAKAEVSQKVTSMVKGAVAIAAGAVFGVFAIVFGFATAAWGLNSLLDSLWLGFVIVFGALLAATTGTFLFARQKLKVGAPTPTMAIDEAKKIRETVSASTNGGSAVAKAAEAVKAEAEASS
jgi:uncharacterized small protein (DUF1192 family)